MSSWLWYTLLATIAGSLAVVLAKAGLRESPEYVALFVRTVVLFLVATAVSFWSGQMKSIIKLSPTSLLLLIATGVSTSLYWLFYYKALKVANAHYVAALDKGGIIITALLSIVVLKEPLSIRAGIGILLVVAGCILMVSSNKQ